MRLLVVKYMNVRDGEALNSLLENGYTVCFATPVKDCIYYILKK